MPRLRFGLLVVIALVTASQTSAQSPAQTQTTPTAATWSREAAPVVAPSATTRNQPEATISRPNFPPLVSRTHSANEAGASASGTATRSNGARSNGASSSAVSGPTITVASSLAVVLGLFAGTVWLTRRFSAGARSNRTVPSEAVEVLGSSILDTRTKLSLIRVGTRVVVLAQTAQGVHPISEITNLDEANELIATCRGDSKRGFAEQLRSIEREPHPPGFVDATTEPPPRRRLFATA